MSPAAEKMIQRLDRARQRWWLFSLLSTTVLAGCALFGVFLALMAADASIRLPQGWLLGLSAAWLAATGVLIVGVAAAWPADTARWRPPRGGWKWICPSWAAT